MTIEGLVEAATGAVPIGISDNLARGAAEVIETGAEAATTTVRRLTPPWLSVLAVDGSGVDWVLTQLRAAIERREQLLQELCEREWRPEFGPWLVFLVDEFAELTVADLNRLIEATQAEQTTQADNAVHAMMRRARSSLGIRSGILESFARKCRALGVAIIVATQYPTADVVDTQVRSQFSLRFMCRVSSKEQVKVCLGNGMEEHVDVRDLSPDQPGSFVVAGLETNVFTAWGTG